MSTTSRAFGHQWVSEAPVESAACVSEDAYHKRYQEPDKTREDGAEIDWPVPYWHFDIGALSMVLLLAVVDAGLAAGYCVASSTCRAYANSWASRAKSHPLASFRWAIPMKTSNRRR